MDTPDLRWLAAATGGPHTTAFVHRPWWQQTPIAWRAPVWRAIAAVLLALGLLAAFHQVVTGAVQRGDQHRIAVAAQGDAAWRCKVLRNVADRQSCVLQVVGTPDPMPQASPDGFSTVALARLEPRRRVLPLNTLVTAKER